MTTVASIKRNLAQHQGILSTPCNTPELEEAPVLAASAAHDAVICVETHTHHVAAVAPVGPVWRFLNDHRVVEQLHEAIVVTGGQVLVGLGPAAQ
jgi:hypothetical protein